MLRFSVHANVMIEMMYCNCNSITPAPPPLFKVMGKIIIWKLSPIKVTQTYFLRLIPFKYIDCHKSKTKRYTVNFIYIGQAVHKTRSSWATSLTRVTVPFNLWRCLLIFLLIMIIHCTGRFLKIKCIHFKNDL